MKEDEFKLNLADRHGAERGQGDFRDADLKERGRRLLDKGGVVKAVD